MGVHFLWLSYFFVCLFFECVSLKLSLLFIMYMILPFFIHSTLIALCFYSRWCYKQKQEGFLWQKRRGWLRWEKCNFQSHSRACYSVFKGPNAKVGFKSMKVHIGGNLLKMLPDRRLISNFISKNFMKPNIVKVKKKFI